jgi:hypothetical protein
MFADVMDLYGQIYVLKDVASLISLFDKHCCARVMRCFGTIHKLIVIQNLKMMEETRIEVA